MADYTTHTGEGRRIAREVVDPGMEGSDFGTEGPGNSMASAIDALDYQLDRAREIVERMHNRLGPILKAPIPEPTSDAKRQGHDDLGSDIRNVFIRQETKLRDTLDALQAMMDRIDL